MSPVHPTFTRFLLRRFAFAAAGVLLACPVFGEEAVRTLAPGVTYSQQIMLGETPQIVNILRVNLAQEGVSVRNGQAHDVISLSGPLKGRETLNTLAIRQKAIAAVNADFFPYTGEPLGLAVRDGELLSEPMPNRICFGLSPKSVLLGLLAPMGRITTADNTLLTLHGVNRVPHGDDITVLTPTFAASPLLEKGGTVVVLRNVNLPLKLSKAMQGTVELVVPVEAGQPVPPCPADGVLLAAVGKSTLALAAHTAKEQTLSFRMDVKANDKPEPEKSAQLEAWKPVWADVEQAVGGGPWLVRNGQITIDGDREGLDKISFVEKAHPRTAVGVTDKGELIFVTVDGRQPFSRGMALADLAALMQKLGAVHAMNLDGGGSTSMLVGEGVVNAPGDGRLRPIANALLIYAPSEIAADVPDFTVRPEQRAETPIRVGEAVRFVVKGADGNTRSSDALWGTRDGLGFINQQGVFVSYFTGASEILARRNGKTVALKITVQAGPPAKIVAKLAPLPNSPPDSQRLTVTVTDRYGNPVPIQKVTLAATGGTTEAVLVTDAKGTAKTDIQWDLTPGAKSITAVLTTGVRVVVKPAIK